MTFDDVASAQTHDYFLQEATELLQTMDDELQDLAQSFSVQRVHNLMRAAHTLKGAAASAGLDSIKEATHSLEDIFKALCHQDTSISIEMEGLIFEAYDCLKLLMSAQLAGSQVDESDIANRMVGIVAQLQVQLGDRFGQEGYLPTSTELGFDVTQSIFEVGVTQRLEAFEEALIASDVEALSALMQSQAEIFVGLAESLDLPGFGAIARAAQSALNQNPHLALEIAPVALANYQAARADVLAGDRTSGGTPSAALEQFAIPQSKADTLDSVENNWLLRILKPPVCLIEEEAGLPPSDDLVPEQLGLLDLSEESKEASLSEAIAFLESTDFNDEALLSDFIPEDLHEVDLLSDPEDRELDIRVSKSLDTQSSDSAESVCVSTDIDILYEDYLEEDVVEADISSALQTDAEWLDIELPEPNLSALEDADNNHTDTDQTADTKFPIAEPSNTLPSVIELSDLELPALELPVLELSDDASLSVNALTTEQLGAEVGSKAAELETLPDLSLVFQLEADRVLSSTARATKQGNRYPQKTSSASSKQAKGQASKATLRISIEHLERLSQTMGKLLTQQNRQSLYAEQLVLLVKQLLEKTARQQKQLDRSQHATTVQKLTQPHQQNILKALSSNSEAVSSSIQFDSLELDQYSDVQLFAQTISESTAQQKEDIEAIDLCVRQSSQTLDRQKRLLASLRETLIEVRMLPLETVFRRFSPALQRLEAQHSKRVNLTTVGSNILVDRVILDKLYDPLLHLLRNAFDHGIEPVEQRQEKNKPAVGTIALEALQQGRHLVINVKDDGQGLDLASIRCKAVEKALITDSEAAVLTPEQTTDLLFEPGFSTARKVSHLSGRGVGLDAVRAQVRSLQGRVTVNCDRATGTCFTLQIPSSLTIAKLMLCEADGRKYALIADAIEHILIPSAQQVRIWEVGRAIAWKANGKEHLVPVRTLSNILHYASPISNRTSLAFAQIPSADAGGLTNKPIILVRYNNSLVGLEVDRLLGEQELAINAIGTTLAPPVYLYGSSILPDGKLTLVLDSVAIAKLALEKGRYLADSTDTNLQQTLGSSLPRQKLALTIDDSITVRNSIAEALQEAGYQVIQAKDGAAGLQQLRDRSDIDAVICDLEMPGMNGFEFLTARQQVPSFTRIPTIVLTSRDNPKHRLLARELGAIAYLTKPFFAPELIATVADAIDAARLSVSTTGECI